MNGRSLLLLTLLAATAAAQEPQLPYAEEIEVRGFDVDVVVTDRQGNRITTLTREDFELFEDGKPDIDLAPLKVPAKVPVNAEGMQLMVTVEDRASHTRSVIMSAIPKR